MTHVEQFQGFRLGLKDVISFVGFHEEGVRLVRSKILLREVPNTHERNGGQAIS